MTMHRASTRRTPRDRFSWRGAAAGITATLVGVAIASIASGADFVFEDGDFANSDWTTEVFFTSGNGGSASATQVAVGGNPGSYWRVTHNIGSRPAQVYVFHERAGAVYDPQVQGPVSGIDFSFDAKTFVDPGYGGQSSSLGIRQGGESFFGPTFHNGNSVWQSTVRTGLTAVDFSAWDGLTHPDFSSTGGVMRFGLFTSNTNPEDGFSGASTTIVDYDNWTVGVSTTITSVRPELLSQVPAFGPTPNPFQLQTTLRFALDRPGTLRLGVFDVAGRAVFEKKVPVLPPGVHSISWDGLDTAGRRVPAGTYLYRLRSDSWTATGRFTLVR